MALAAAGVCLQVGGIYAKQGVQAVFAGLGQGHGAAVAAAENPAQVETAERRHAERMHLASLDDAALKDVGLSRSDVQAELDAPFWRR